jgi:hypothetical protein
MLGFLEILILSALAIAVAFVVIVRRRRPRALSTAGHTAPNDPRCGKCGYIVRGVPSLHCPECGSDLREVGIVTPAHRRAAGPFPHAVIWTLVLLLVAVPVAGLLIQALPHWRQYTTSRVVFLQHPELNVILRATATAQGIGRAGPRQDAPAPRTVTLASDKGGFRSDLEFEPATGAHRYTDASGARVDRPGGFGPDVIAAWLTANNAPSNTMAPAALRARAADVETCVTEMTAGRGSTFTHLGRETPGGVQTVTAHPTFAHSRPTAWNTVALIVLGLVVWWLGVSVIYRRHGVAVPEGAASAGATLAGKT